MTSGTLFVVSAPSGAGKTSLVKGLLQVTQGLLLSVSYTTRAPRPGEVDGRDYHFVTRAQFQEMQKAGEFLESAEVYDNLYGTSHRWVRSQMEAGRDILLEIDTQGAAQVRKLLPECVGIFILPPSPEALEARLRARGQDSAEAIARRLATAREEMGHVGAYEYVIINDKLDVALQDFASIIRAERLRLPRQIARHGDLFKRLK